jgi:hypothetical protein
MFLKQERTPQGTWQKPHFQKPKLPPPVFAELAGAKGQVVVTPPSSLKLDQLKAALESLNYRVVVDVPTTGRTFDLLGLPVGRLGKAIGIFLHESRSFYESDRNRLVGIGVPAGDEVWAISLLRSIVCASQGGSRRP